jgi:hypothetical protein
MKSIAVNIVSRYTEQTSRKLRYDVASAARRAYEESP